MFRSLIVSRDLSTTRTLYNVTVGYDAPASKRLPGAPLGRGGFRANLLAVLAAVLIELPPAVVKYVSI